MTLVRPLLAAAVVCLSLAGVALAQGPASTKLVLELPPEGAAGQEMTASARLADEAGGAIVAATVLFRREVVFMNTGVELGLGQAVTNGQGIAALTFAPRSEGEMRITAEFKGNAQHRPSGSEKVVLIKTGPQLYVETAGVRIPGINVGLLAAVLGGVWVTYFIVMSRIFLIAREGMESSPRSGETRE